MGPPIRTQPPPVSPDELYRVVCGAASQNPTEVHSSATRLKELLELPSTYNVLQEIVAQRSVPLQVRQQAAIQFKNSAMGHWRLGGQKSIQQDQKLLIKERCLALLDEPDDIIAECNVIVASKIARAEYPALWPNLISHLGDVINSSLQTRYTNKSAQHDVVLRRSLELLNAILKEFANMKMITGVKSMSKMMEDVRQPMQAYYAQISTTISSSLTPSGICEMRTAEDLLLAHIMFKCLEKIIVWSYQRCAGSSKDFQHLEPWIEEVFQNSRAQLATLSETRINLASALTSLPTNNVANRSLDLLTRHIRRFGKMFRRMQQLSPAKFVTLPMCSELVLYYWSKVVQSTTVDSAQVADSSTAVFPLRFLVQGMSLLKDSLSQWAPKRRDGGTNANVLSQEFVVGAVQLLLTKFMPLNLSDLDGWQADPEEWVNTEEQETEQWEFELRPCSERVLMALAHQYPDYVTPLLSGMFTQMIGQTTLDLTSTIQKEALYCAIGRCAIRLKDVVPFERWLHEVLVKEVQETNQYYPIIKRRIAWLLSRLIHEECMKANDATLWTVYVHLLQDRGSGSDSVVRLTAAISIKACVDSLNFDADVFAPFLPAVMTSLVQLIAEAETLESKRRISTALNIVIERAEHRIVPYIAMAADPIPQLWTTADKDWLFKSCLLETVQKLIESGKEHANALSALVVPLVVNSFTPEAQTFLETDAFNLWLSSVSCTTSIEGFNGGPGLINLVPLIITQLANNQDVLGSIVEIVESYFVLDASRVLQLYAVDLLQAFREALTLALPVNAKQLTGALNMLFQVAPSSLWGEAMHTSGLFSLIVQHLEEDKNSTIVLTDYVYVLARLALADKRLFLQLVSATAASHKTSESSIWEPILNQWWTRFDNMSEPHSRKLTAMGIASLVSTGRPEVLDRLSSEICNLWIDVFGEIRERRESDERSPEGLSLYWDRPFADTYQGKEGIPEYERRKTIFENDPVRTMQLSRFINARIQEAGAACGGPGVLQAQYLAKAEPSLLSQIQAELTADS